MFDVHENISMGKSEKWMGQKWSKKRREGGSFLHLD